MRACNVIKPLYNAAGRPEIAETSHNMGN